MSPPFVIMCTNFSLTLAGYPSWGLYPQTLTKPSPIPAKYPYPYTGSRVLTGRGRGQPKMTRGLPVLITTAPRIFPTYSLILGCEDRRGVAGESSSPEYDSASKKEIVYICRASASAPCTNWRLGYLPPHVNKHIQFRKSTFTKAKKIDDR